MPPERARDNLPQSDEAPAWSDKAVRSMPEDTGDAETKSRPPVEPSKTRDQARRKKPAYLKQSFWRLFLGIKRLLFSSLTRRILILNMVALAALLASLLYMNQFREGLTDAKIESLLAQGKIIASAISSSATASVDSIIIDPERLIELRTGESLQPRLDPLDNLQYPISPEKIAPVLRALIKPSQTRARIYDPDGILILDSRFLYDSGRLQRFDLPPLSGETREKERIGWSRWTGDLLSRLLRDRNLPIYKEFVGPGINYPEVQSALTGSPRPVVRQTKQGKLTVSVAVPIQRFRAVLGVLLLSTEGDDIDRIVREERLDILRTFFVAAIVMFVLSALLANTIATPLRKLSEAAIRVKRGIKDRIGIPDLSSRNDEIGELSVSLLEMTNSLYSRIDAIERFAADVSHELKNPLTSLRSAVETLPLARNEDSKQRLLEVIQHDVRRLDRLITDISDASRLDADLVRDTARFVDFAQLLLDVVNTRQTMNRRRKQVDVSVVVDDKKSNKADYIISGHDTRLGQVINNLLDNAISFVPETGGKIVVYLSRDNQVLTMQVNDNGPGIRAEDTSRVFERFYTDRAETDGFGQNSGLGLSISRQIIEAHGGTMQAGNRSDGHSGAVFTVTLPIETR